ncbi:tyrosine-type recombinase/integrase [Rufibacter aurantiacus]|uniref:tyrosine-type recombinase/integrase n=1 Tax=Rufibacter aurantiacus TaxID=2817374 RepID=UPI001B30367A|nr:tyrosine-type recombinase/integrase [Rufibacter aurantiacus]
MFTDPKIINPQDLNQRGYILFYYDGKRYRFYNGKALGINCAPNSCDTHAARERLLKQLLRSYTRALLTGWTPEQEKPKVQKRSLLQLLEQVVKDVQGSSYSSVYQRDMIKVVENFTEFLISDGRRDALPEKVVSADIERFLQQFSSSGTYYQNKRRTLAAVFSRLVKQGFCKVNPVLETSKRKAKAVLHQAYTPEQLAPVLSFLKGEYPNLYLCALLMYGTLLRPHRKIRLLKRRHFNEDFTTFSLDGKENKSGRIRSLPVPEFVREELVRRQVGDLQPEENIFTSSLEPFNESYFNTMWSRAKAKMSELRLIQPQQTLYSFRHAASVNVFTRTQNLKLLQQLLGHSNLNTSMTYLRSIGAIQVESSMMPEL